MIELKGFPMRDQLKSIVRPSDGGPDENRVYNCVPASLAACIQYFTGKVIAADDLRDQVYGDRSIGGGAALAYRPLLRSKYGLWIGYTPLPSASQAIIDHIRAELRAWHPVVVTMHSHWSTPWPKDGGDGLHVGVAYAISEDDRGTLHIMNPWRGFDHAESVTWWRDRLGNGVWPVSKIASPVVPPAPKPAPDYTWNEATRTLTGNGAKLVLTDLGRS